MRGNIPEELVPLWEKVKGRMKDGPRKSRTEAFLQYAQEHPHEILASAEHETDVRLAELLAEREKRDAELAAVEQSAAKAPAEAFAHGRGARSPRRRRWAEQGEATPF